MFLFIISFLLVFLSSYFITSMIFNPKNNLGFIYIFIIAFAQIILTFELLSLVNGINPFGILGMNIIFADTAFYLWRKQGKPIWQPHIRDLYTKVKNSLKLDKSLAFLYFSWCVFIISAVFLCLVMPTTSADGRAYHITRALYWATQGNLGFFPTADIRALCMPINSEILYAWIFSFTKSAYFLGFFSLLGYFLSISAVYKILSFLGYCTRKKLWTIFILSSFTSVIVLSSGTETDMIISGLILSSIAIFWSAIKHNDQKALYVSSLAYAIALGVKTTAFFAIPGVAILFLYLCKNYKNYKFFGKFLKFGLINFAVFSAYNYLQNLIFFQNAFGSQYFMPVSKNYYGIQGAIANFIKHLFMFFDFTGFTWAKFFGPSILSTKNSILIFLGLGSLRDGLYSPSDFLNNTLLEPLMGMGVVGFLVCIPCLAWTLGNLIFKFKSKKASFLFVFSTMFFVNLFFMSSLIAYMSYNIRFLTMLFTLSSVVLVYSYFKKRNPIKYIVIFFAMFSMIFVSTSLWARPFVKSAMLLKSGVSISELRFRAECMDFEKKSQITSAECLLKRRISLEYENNNKIIAFLSEGVPTYMLKTFEKEGYNITFANLEEYNELDLSSYNIVILPKNEQTISNIIKYLERENNLTTPYSKYEEFYKDEYVPCIYIKNKTIPLSINNEEIMPYAAKCKINNKFLEKYNLKFASETGVTNLKTNEKTYYDIYENKNLPPIKRTP